MRSPSLKFVYNIVYKIWIASLGQKTSSKNDSYQKCSIGKSFGHLYNSHSSPFQQSITLALAKCFNPSQKIIHWSSKLWNTSVGNWQSIDLHRTWERAISGTKIKNVVPLLFTDFIKRNAVLFFSTGLVHYSIWSNERQQRQLSRWIGSKRGLKGLRELLDGQKWIAGMDSLPLACIFISWICMYVRM